MTSCPEQRRRCRPPPTKTSYGPSATNHSSNGRWGRGARSRSPFPVCVSPQVFSPPYAYSLGMVGPVFVWTWLIVSIGQTPCRVGAGRVGGPHADQRLRLSVDQPVDQLTLRMVRRMGRTDGLHPGLHRAQFRFGASAVEQAGNRDHPDVHARRRAHRAGVPAWRSIWPASGSPHASTMPSPSPSRSACRSS